MVVALCSTEAQAYTCNAKEVVDNDGVWWHLVDGQAQVTGPGFDFPSGASGTLAFQPSSWWPYIRTGGSWLEWSMQGWRSSNGPPECASVAPMASCDSFEADALGTHWSIANGYAYLPSWSWYIAPADFFRALNNTIYMNRNGNWFVWAGPEHWVPATPPACNSPANDPSRFVANVALWNIYWGNGVASINGVCMDRNGNPMVQDSSQTSSGLLDGHVTADAVLRDLTNDNELVVLALNETGSNGHFGGVDYPGTLSITERVAQLLGWPDAQITPITPEGDAIIARYGWVEGSLGHSQPLPARNANVVVQSVLLYLNQGHSKTMHFFNVHYEANHEANAGQRDCAGGCYDTGMQAILNYINSVAGNAPRILVGDLNASDGATDAPLPAAASTSGSSYHQDGIRLIRDTNGYRDMFRKVNTEGRHYTATLNKVHTGIWDEQLSYGMSPGDGWKRIDYAFSKNIPNDDIVSATLFGQANGGGGGCLASDHLGVKVGITVH